MRKFVSAAFITIILTMIGFTQEIKISDVNYSISRDFNKVITLSGTKANIHDTVYFNLARLSNEDSAKSLILNNVINLVGQYFECPQQITVSKVSFYAITPPSLPLVACTVELYNAGADSLPTGVALASVVVNVDSSILNGYEIFATFPSPVVRNQPFCITLSNASTNQINVITTNYKTHDGQGDGYSFARLFSTWYHGKDLTFGPYIFDADFLIHPVVDYTLVNPTFTKNPTCLVTPNTNVNFTLNCPAIYTSRMYNYWAYDGTPEKNFGWRYGDGYPYVIAMNTSHIYATPASYNIRLYYQYLGWGTATVPDSVTDVISICAGINENSENEVSIYPNPVNNDLFIINAKGSEFELINTLGEVLQSRKIDNDNFFVDVSDFSSGTYMIRFKSSAGIFSKKIIIE